MEKPVFVSEREARKKEIETESDVEVQSDKERGQERSTDGGDGELGKCLVASLRACVLAGWFACLPACLLACLLATTAQRLKHSSNIESFSFFLLIISNRSASWGLCSLFVSISRRIWDPRPAKAAARHAGHHGGICFLN